MADRLSENAPPPLTDEEMEVVTAMQLRVIAARDEEDDDG